LSHIDWYNGKGAYCTGFAAEVNKG